MVIKIDTNTENVARMAKLIRETTSDEMVEYLKGLSDEKVIEFAIDQGIRRNEYWLAVGFPRRISQIK